LKGHALAEFVSHLLEVTGYQTRLSPEGPDGGIDIIAHKDELGFEPPIIKVQVKSTEGSIGDPIVSQLYGKVEKSEYGMVITLGSFTNQAVNFARNKGEDYKYTYGCSVSYLPKDDKVIYTLYYKREGESHREIGFVSKRP
jgi:predicted Mrr-cat superfamily restriction endonuclease